MDTMSHNNKREHDKDVKQRGHYAQEQQSNEVWLKGRFKKRF